MAYEYSTQGATLDFPNPYRIENQFLGLRGLVLLLAGVGLLWFARGAGQAVEVAVGVLQGRFVLLIIGGAVLVLLGILEIATAARQLRVFFGRGQPASLAVEIPREAEGAGNGAVPLMETIRQGAIPLAVPAGPLNGLLYSMSRHLVTAPRTLREYVQARFANLLAAGGLLLLFGITWVITPESAARALAALVYVVLGGVLIVRSYVLRGPGGVVALGPLGLALLLVFGLVGTVLIGRAAGGLPQLAWLVNLSLPQIAFVLLGASVTIEALGLVAGHAHIDPPPPASTANEQLAVSFQADPNLLMQEVDRELQRRWVESIPNRRYLWQPPHLEAQREAGNFKGMVLEETQPLPPQAVRRMDWATCFAFPRFWWLAVLDVLGLALTVVGCLLWLQLGRELAAGAAPAWSAASIGLIFIVVGGYGLRVAHLLWGRLDFESTLVWLDFNGSFARAQVGLGAQWTDRVRSDRTVISVESMTLRAWVVKARSVIFDYRDTAVGSRTLVGMAGDMDAARGWSQQVRQFAQAQSMLVVPGSAADAQRLAQLQGANQLAGAARPPEITASAPPAPVPMPAVARHCTACGAAAQPGARFCHACGTALPA